MMPELAQQTTAVLNDVGVDIPVRAVQNMMNLVVSLGGLSAVGGTVFGVRRYRGRGVDPVGNIKPSTNMSESLSTQVEAAKAEAIAEYEQTRDIADAHRLLGELTERQDKFDAELHKLREDLIRNRQLSTGRTGAFRTEPKA